MGDVAPLPLDGDDDDFFSDLGSDDTISPPRLVIDHSYDQQTNRINPFGGNTDHNTSNRNGVINTYDSVARNRNQSQRTTDTPNEESLGTSEESGHSAESSQHCHVPHKHEADNVVRNQLIAISIVTLIFMIGEGIGAIYANSVALGTDVAHLASDLLSFIFSLIAIYFTKKSATKRYTWGYFRGEVLGALVSVFIIWVVTGVLVYLAIERVIHKEYDHLDPTDMLITAACSVAFNLIMGLILNIELCRCKVSHGHSHGGGGGGGHGHSHGGGHSHSNMVRMRSRNRRRRRNNDDREQLTDDLTDTEDESNTGLSESDGSAKKEKNIVIRAAFVHVIGDLIQSVGVLIAAVLIYVLGPQKAGIADPICTFIFSVLVLFTTVTVLRDSFLILMEGRPRSVSYEQLYEKLAELEGVKSVHSLRVWALTSNEITASVHIAVDEGIAKPFDLVVKANDILRSDGLITSSTVQVEPFDPVIMDICAECNNSKQLMHTTTRTA